LWIAVAAVAGLVALGALWTDSWSSSHTPADKRTAGGAFLEIDWTYIGPQGPRADPDVGRRLRMHIPDEYVSQVHRDRKGEAERTTRVKNGGLDIVVLEGWLPELTPRPSRDVVKAVEVFAEKERGRELAKHRVRVTVRAEGEGYRKGTLRRNVERRLQAKSLHRLPDAHGLKRYRSIFCGELEWHQAAPRFADDRAPEGCREIASNEILWPASESEDNVWISCDRRPGGNCALYPRYQSFWSLRVDLAKEELARWREYMSAAYKLLDRFLVTQ
jgi:hypothetical protein